MDIADKITFWRTKRKYSTTKLANLAGIAQSTLREIELKNTSPTWDTIEKLSAALEISTIELVSTSEVIHVSESQATYDTKIKNLPQKDRQIVDTIIKLNEVKDEQAATAEGK